MKIAIEGMHCDACVRRVRKALEKIDGVTVEDVTVGSATVTGGESQKDAVVNAIREAGYEPRANT